MEKRTMKAQLMFGFLAVSTSALGSTSTTGDKTSIDGVIHGGIGSNLIQQRVSGVIHNVSSNRHGSIVARIGGINSNNRTSAGGVNGGDKTGINASGGNGSVSNGTAGIQE
jgi:hypothetical protein